jgi:hypothetical protein
MSLATFSALGVNSRVRVDLPSTVMWPGRQLKLVSMDFPVSQRGIERDWSCIYYSEALRVTDGARTVTVLVTRTDGMEELYTALLPLTSNRVVAVAHVNDRVEFTTASRHGLFVEGISLIPVLESIFCRGAVPLTLIHSRDGVFDITSADDVRYVSEFTVSLPLSCVRVDLSTVSTSGTRGYLVVPSLPNPAALCSLLIGAFSNKIYFAFDATTGRTSVMGSPGVTVNSVGGDTLAQWLLGFDGVFTAWEVCRLPLSSFSPVDFAAALESAMNPFVVVPGASGLRYRDAFGAVHDASLIPGQYRTPFALVAAVERAMEPHMPSDFRVTFVENTVRFVCSSPFDLLFGSSQSCCEALGFGQWDLVGLKEYFSNDPVYGHCVRPNTNTYEVCIRDNNCLSVTGSSSHVIGTVESYRRCVLRVRTSTATGMAVAHGVLPGEMVTLCDSEDTNVKRLVRTRRVMGVVVEVGDGCVCDADVMCISVPYHGWKDTSELVILLPRSEFSFCALAPMSCSSYFVNTIGGARIGFRDEVVFANNGTLLAPYPIALEHPSRVFVFLEDANGDAHSTEPEHVVDDRRIFAQVMVDERRVVPSTARMRTEGSSLQLRFVNMDRTPYVFNNAVVSFTLELS